jgi:hypothetical protein
MKNIHLLATDKPSRLFKFANELHLDNTPKDYYKKYNIYITSDEEIKVNDYITDGYRAWKWKDDSSLLGRKKIILTTDQDLIADGVQSIDDEFLEWFVKNPSCEEVEVEHERVLWENGEITHYKYNIIFPKKEAKQTDEKGNPLTYWGGLEEPKQETLENKLELLISEWNKRQLQYTDLASQNIDCSHTTKKFTYKAMATRDCWKELLTLLNNHKDEQTRNT